ncbi:phosphotransferase family protein [Streptacidiphilus cavernicola]|uniref:Phosphotransferase family protein n=1 Tax=Streptacidiphilus cavernicola TaxID=3342716 RepID=A0ABV6VSE8_9ACTN
MTDRDLPDPATVEAVLGSHQGAWGVGGRVLAVQDLSPGLGRAAVLRVSTTAADGRPAQWIVKIPDWGNGSLLDSRDSQLDRREARFFASGIPGLLPSGLATPPDVGLLRHDGLTWIVMRDVGAALRRPWDPAAARALAARTALLHAPGAAHPDLLDTPWLEREGHAAYAHHIPSGHDNLDALADDPRLSTLFTAEQVRALHACLDAAGQLDALAAGLPATLVHGDLQPLNAGLDGDGTLLLIDWEHVGVGPVGFDLGTFVSLYRAFGGSGSLDEQQLLAVHGDALSELAGADLRPAVARGFAVAHLSWGLHLRLGPGLTAVRQGAHGESPEELAPHLDDIRSGCLRALAWAPVAGIGAAAGR